MRVSREKGWERPEFVELHANSKGVLPAMFNGGFEKREAQARKLLEKLDTAEGNGSVDNAVSTPAKTARGAKRRK